MSYPKSSLMLETIPPEIRVCVYQCLVRTRIFQIRTQASTSGSSRLKVFLCDPPVATNLLQVCKLLYQEARLVLLRDNVFQFLHPLPDLCSSPLPASTLAIVRTVIIGPFQSTARSAVCDMTATRLCIQSVCLRLETLSSRHWLVKHAGAHIDNEQDFAPILDTTYYFDVADSTSERQPLKYTMGILKSTKTEDGLVSGEVNSVDVYCVLYPKLISKDERESVFKMWARVSTKCLLSLVEKGGEREIACKSSLKDISTCFSIDATIETDWKSVADDLGYGALLLR